MHCLLQILVAMWGLCGIVCCLLRGRGCMYVLVLLAHDVLARHILVSACASVLVQTVW